jgi:hypothetical protein
MRGRGDRNATHLPFPLVLIPDPLRRKQAWNWSSSLRHRSSRIWLNGCRGRNSCCHRLRRRGVMGRIRGWLVGGWLVRPLTVFDLVQAALQGIDLLYQCLDCGLFALRLCFCRASQR